MAAQVTVVIPARDAAAYLEEAVLSVLAQTEPVHEIIVVDDGSRDGTGELARGFGAPVRCIGQPAAGPGQARNRGVEAATTELVAFLDADDLWPPESLRCRLAALEADPGCEAAFGEVEQFICDRLSPSERARIHIPVPRLPGLVAGAMLVRRSLFARVGMFPVGYRASEFVAWYLKARRAGLGSVMLPDLVLRRRIHTTNLGRTDPRGRNEVLAILRADLAQRG